jgi:hypothetical protein
MITNNRTSGSTSLALLALLLLSPFAAQHAVADAPKSHADFVRTYILAFNERQIDTMLQMVTDDVQWISVTGDKLTVETQGKEQLGESLAAYFKSTPSAKSELEWVQATSARVAALERASWQAKSGPKSQSSLCVYEFRDGLIARVYYYPVEK